MDKTLIEPSLLLKPSSRTPHELQQALSLAAQLLQSLVSLDNALQSTQQPEWDMILTEQQNSQKQQFVLILEWLRRQDSQLDAHLRHFLFTQRPLIDLKHNALEGSLTELTPTQLLSTPPATPAKSIAKPRKVKKTKLKE